MDLWIYWYPDDGRLEIHLDRFTGRGGRLDLPQRPDLEQATRQPVDDVRELRPVLQAWAEALRVWLDEETRSPS